MPLSASVRRRWASSVSDSGLFTDEARRNAAAAFERAFAGEYELLDEAMWHGKPVFLAQNVIRDRCGERLKEVTNLLVSVEVLAERCEQLSRHCSGRGCAAPLTGNNVRRLN